MSTRSIDVGSISDSATAQRSPLHPHTPHTPALGSPEILSSVHGEQDEKALHQSFNELLRDEYKENDETEHVLVEKCAMLAKQSLQFQQQCEALMAENTRLKQSHEHEGNAVLAEQLAIQVQHLMQEKARILQQKEMLEKENGNLQQVRHTLYWLCTCGLRAFRICCCYVRRCCDTAFFLHSSVRWWSQTDDGHCCGELQCMVALCLIGAIY